jgi:hypothetical protein
MTLDDGTPGLRRKLNLAALGAAIVLIALARACGLRDARPAPDVPRSEEVTPQGSSVSKDHGASAGAPQDK